MNSYSGRRLCKDRQMLCVPEAEGRLCGWPQLLKRRLNFSEQKGNCRVAFVLDLPATAACRSTSCLTACPWVNQKNANIHLSKLARAIWGVNTWLNTTWSIKQKFEESTGLELGLSLQIPSQHQDGENVTGTKFMLVLWFKCTVQSLHSAKCNLFTKICHSFESKRHVTSYNLK